MKRFGILLVVVVQMLCSSIGFGQVAAATGGDATPLLATSAAPAGATGTMEFQRENGGRTSLHIRVQRLSPGAYRLYGKQKSDGKKISLGLMSVPDPTAQPDREANQNSKTDSSTHATEVLQVETRVNLPPAVIASDLGKISICNSAEIVLLESR